ncbi:MAG: response regulator transcription factor [Treponema sp.]|nr:response regulator transcription factor [Treponema sp.]
MNENNPYIYVIEDEESLSKLICLYLSKSDMTPRPFASAELAIEALKTDTQPDLIILDLNLPGMPGFKFLEFYRENYDKNTPVMIASARDADEDIIQGLNIGADEFVTKPFSPSVLVARVKANLRRQTIASAMAEESFIFNDFTLLLNSCVLKKGSKKIPLSTKEYEVLEYLLKHAGEILSPEKIYSDVWNVQYGDITAVAVYIQRLRKKLGRTPDNKDYILTEFGKGYIFDKSQINSK